MFDIGFSELFVAAIVALLVLGPERLPKAARFTGLWVRKARAQWYSVKSELENELADEDLKRSLQQARDDLAQARSDLQRSGSDVRREFDGLDPDGQESAVKNGASDASDGGVVDEDAPDEDAPKEKRDEVVDTLDSARAELEDEQPASQYEDWLLEDSDVHAPSDYDPSEEAPEIDEPGTGAPPQGDPEPADTPRGDPHPGEPRRRDPDPGGAPQREPDAPPPAAAGR